MYEFLSIIYLRKVALKLYTPSDKKIKKKNLQQIVQNLYDAKALSKEEYTERLKVIDLFFGILYFKRTDLKKNVMKCQVMIL